MTNENPLYGLWKVTTEGDCEGRYIKFLGVYEGYIDDIALSLADQAEYQLGFEYAKQKISKCSNPFAEKVHISIPRDLYGGNLGRTTDSDTRAIGELFKDRPVSVEASNYYDAVLLVSNNAEEIRKQKALAKLSDEDKAVLGLL